MLRTPLTDPGALCAKFTFIVAALFLLSPTQFPWYYTWLVPLLVLTPQVPLLLLTALLPIYYLRFYFAVRGEAVVFDLGIVWLEYAPVWILIGWKWFNCKRAVPLSRPAESATRAR